jgi:hypothetical protein
MTIISRVETDNTKRVAKRFAALAVSYLDDPHKAKSRTAQIPLQNIYRLLEMFRYDAFADEGRRGVLALDRSESGKVSMAPRPPEWHLQIKGALKSAMDSTYADGQTREKALDEVEGDLHTLATKGKLPPPKAEKVRKFLTTFENALV